MAEERLIDDDLNKDKKYRIRKNADGEEELYIDETGESEEGDFYEVTELNYDDEEAASLTPAELEERKATQKAEAEKNAELLKGYLAEAESLINGGEFERALPVIEKAEKADSSGGASAALKLRAITRDFSDFSRAEECADCARIVKSFCSEEEKAALAQKGGGLKAEYEKLEERAAELHVEVEQKKTERRAVFNDDKNRWIKWFAISVIPFVVFLVMTIAYATIIYTRSDGLNLILTIVFGALAAVSFGFALFTAHKMWEAMKKVALNEKNSSTKLGREYEEVKARAAELKNIYASFGEVQ